MLRVDKNRYFPNVVQQVDLPTGDCPIFLMPRGDPVPVGVPFPGMTPAAGFLQPAALSPRLAVNEAALKIKAERLVRLGVELLADLSCLGT